MTDWLFCDQDKDLSTIFVCRSCRPQQLLITYKFTESHRTNQLTDQFAVSAWIQTVPGNGADVKRIPRTREINQMKNVTQLQI